MFISYFLVRFIDWREVLCNVSLLALLNIFIFRYTLQIFTLLFSQTCSSSHFLREFALSFLTVVLLSLLFSLVASLQISLEVAGFLRNWSEFHGFLRKFPDSLV